jgi:small subunit ribosomal protein S4
MISKPKYKIARRLGAPIFEKTQTQKYALRSEKKTKTRGFSKPKSEYGMQHNEKQKARMQYGVSEKQFSKYVKDAVSKKAALAVPSIYQSLELRLDNAIYRLGFAPTRRAARQMVSHGHIMINGKKTSIPSRRMEMGDVISIREGSAGSKLFTTIGERLENVTVPEWISFDMKTKTAEIKGVPKIGGELLFDLNSVVEFYSR